MTLLRACAPLSPLADVFASLGQSAGPAAGGPTRAFRDVRIVDRPRAVERPHVVERSVAAAPNPVSPEALAEMKKELENAGADLVVPRANEEEGFQIAVEKA